MGPVMPPSKKPEASGISVASASLSHLYQASSLQEAEELNLAFPAPLALPLAPLTGGAAKPEKSTSTPGMEDEELTNLNWLHESKNLLNSFGDPVLRSVSPVGGEGGVAGNRGDGDHDNMPPSPIAGGDLPYDADRNPTCKPPYSFSCLIFMAVEDAPSKRLPVKEIYNWILEHFPYFANAPTGWKNSVRHNLSLNKCFKKVDKDRSQSIGKGSLWCIDPEYRQNLIQALKKTPYHPHTQVFSTPPTSPQAYQSMSSPPLWPGSPFFRKNGGVLLQGTVTQALILYRIFSLPPSSVSLPHPSPP
ncbi:forkhead box protein N3-like isoform X1 [Salvelinus alpinus]|uniref:forkhead box protein N3-like isoform X1 n=1 Tax=Salvelinus alpinus TaxID=8036 RepID=UPI0039FBE22F